jgi:hypothetical protein
MRKWLAPLLMFSACGTPADLDENNDDVIVADGKEDDFYSASAKEYWVSGTGTLTVEADAADKMARARELYALKNLQVSWFLNQYLVEKEHDSGNAGYGGFKTLTRFASEESGQLTAVDATTFKFPYRVQVAGGKNLISQLPGTGAAGGKTFDLQMGKVSNAELAQLEFNHEWYRNAPWSSFDPSKLTEDKLEKIALTIKPQAASKDRWLAYDRLYADGELTIAVHFGHDYHGRYDIVGSRSLYDDLVSMGWKSPVESYDKLLRDSGPLTTTIRSNGKPINVKLWIYHPGDPAQNVPGPDPDTDEGGKILENDMKESFKSREVIVFEGHSGPLYGFALANWKKTEEGDLDDSKIPGLEMPKTYQIVLANGCDTYALGAAFWQNPNKSDRQNLNIITSTSFSNAATEASATRLIKALTNQTASKVVPVKVSELVSGLDSDQGWSFDTMYGLHGVDANPAYDPTSDASRLCRTCTSNAGCGADGNRCTRLTSGTKACSFACIDDSGCPSGYSCRSVASAASRTIKTRQCVPTSGVCR